MCIIWQIVSNGHCTLRRCHAFGSLTCLFLGHFASTYAWLLFFYATNPPHAVTIDTSREDDDDDHHLWRKEAHLFFGFDFFNSASYRLDKAHITPRAARRRALPLLRCVWFVSWATIESKKATILVHLRRRRRRNGSGTKQQTNDNNLVPSRRVVSSHHRTILGDDGDDDDGC